MPTLDVAINALRAKQGAQQFDVATKKIKRGAKDVDRSVKKNVSSFKSLGTQMKTAVIGMAGLAAAYKAVRFTKDAVKEAVAFELQLANVATMLNLHTKVFLPEYKTALSDLAVKYGQSTETLSKGLYDILSASIDAADALEVLEVAAKGAIAGLTDTGTAADALTTILNAYGMEAAEAAKVGDILFATVKRGKITFGELAGSIGKVVALAAAGGLSFEQLSAGIATMTRSGIQSEMAMTALKGILTTFLSPQAESILMAKQFGLELNTNTLQTIGLTGALQKLEKHLVTGRAATAEETAAIFSNVRALLGAAAARKSLTALVEDYEGILKSSGVQEEAYQIVADTTAERIKRNHELWIQIKRDFGEGIQPEVDLWLTGMSLLVKDWKKSWSTIADDQASAQAKIEQNMLGFRLLRLIPQYNLMGKVIRKVTAFRNEEAEAILNEDSILEKHQRSLEREGNELVKQAKSYHKILQDQEKAKTDVANALKEVAAVDTKKTEEYLDDQASAYRRLYGDIQFWSEGTYKFKLSLLNAEKLEYQKFVKDKALLDKWYNERKDALDVERDIKSENFFAGFQAGVERMNAGILTWGEIGVSTAENMRSSLSNSLIQMTEAGGNWKDAMIGFIMSVGQAMRRMLADQIAAQIMVSAVSPFTGALIGALTGGLGGGVASGQVLSDTAIMGMPNEKGNVFSAGGVKRFAKGDILSRPTIFPMSNGGVGLAGEAGDEAIMPLGRDSQGRLGVRGAGSEGGSVIKIINVMDQSAVQEYLNTGDGERTVVNIMRRNASELQEAIG